MFTWLKNLFGGSDSNSKDLSDIAIAQSESTVEQAVPVATPKKQAEKPAEPKKKTTKKSATKKSSGTCDFDKLTKTQLLAEAKHRGVKANASLSKTEILERLKNG